jgi:5-methylcytosine-specific restriction endonuclease McrA
MKKKPRRYIKKRKSIVYQRICCDCGKIFNPKNLSQVRCKKCSTPCPKKQPEEKEKLKPQIFFNKTCPQCGSDFVSDRITTKYCSDKCRDEASKNYSPKEYDISKELIFKRDGYRCIYCGKSSIEDGVKLHLEHIFPISKGGREDLFNLAASCERCNLVKSSTVLSESLILRIWKRNENLNKNIDNKTYDELLKVFKSNIESRTNKFRD